MVKEKNHKVSKKGIGITAGILIALTVGSFAIYMMPEDTGMRIVVTDFSSHLNEVKEKNEILSESVDESFQDLLDGKISPKEYISIAEITSSQVTSLMRELVSSEESEEWNESYKNQIASLRKFNTQITETIVVANMLENDQNDKVEQALSKIQQLKDDSIGFLQKSDLMRP